MVFEVLGILAHLEREVEGVTVVEQEGGDDCQPSLIDPVVTQLRVGRLERELAFVIVTAEDEVECAFDELVAAGVECAVDANGVVSVVVLPQFFVKQFQDGCFVFVSHQETFRVGKVRGFAPYHSIIPNIYINVNIIVL